jgi:pimeloyl-ACP methyl ester carboxylesterase
MAVAQARGAWLNWREHGEGEPVLMIMGLSGSARAWWRLLPHVAGEYRAIVFDNRGTGDSDGVSGPMTMADLVHDALAVLDAAGVERAHVVGVSMGGMIAQHLALDHRDRVASVLLGCTTSGGRRGAPPWRLMAATAARPAIGPLRSFELIAPLLYAPATRRDQPDRVAADLKNRARDPTPVRTTLAQMAAIAGHDTRARLPELRGLPVTVLHGDEDVLVPIDRGRELADRIPGARLAVVRGAGHVLTTDREHDTAEAVLRHLEDASTRAGTQAA